MKELFSTLLCSNTIALVNSTRRGAARVTQLWKSSTILSQDVPLLYYKV